MTTEKQEEDSRSELVKQLHADLLAEKEGGIDCIIMDIPISQDPDDPIRKIVDEVLGDFVEIPTPNGTFFFPTSILRS
jgi:hypothetical protein